MYAMNVALLLGGQFIALNYSSLIIFLIFLLVRILELIFVIGTQKSSLAITLIKIL